MATNGVNSEAGKCYIFPSFNGAGIQWVLQEMDSFDIDIISL